MSLSKPVPTLSQMPWNVKQDIVNSANNGTKFSLRGCSKEFKSLVDSSTFHFNYLILNRNTDNSISLDLMVDYHIKRREVKFSAHPLGFMRQTWHMDVQLEKKVFVGPRNYTDAALAKFFKTIGNPKFNIFCLEITDKHSRKQCQSQRLSVLDKIQEFLGSLNRKLSVQAFAMSISNFQEDILKVLPYLEPGTLEMLTFYDEKTNRDRTTDEDLELVGELEQWKQANELTSYHCLNLPLEKWIHFSNCRIKLKGFTLGNVKQVIEAYSNNPNLHFHGCKVKQFRTRNRTEIRNFLSQFTVVLPNEEFKVPIANSTDYIGVYVYPFDIVFVRCPENTPFPAKNSEQSDSSDDSDSSDEEERGDSDAEPQSE